MSCGTTSLESGGRSVAPLGSSPTPSPNARRLGKRCNDGMPCGSEGLRSRSRSRDWGKPGNIGPNESPRDVGASGGGGSSMASKKKTTAAKPRSKAKSTPAPSEERKEVAGTTLAGGWPQSPAFLERLLEEEDPQVVSALFDAVVGMALEAPPAYPSEDPEAVLRRLGEQRERERPTTGQDADPAMPPWERRRQERLPYEEALRRTVGVPPIPDELPPDELGTRAAAAKGALSHLPNHDFLELMFDELQDRTHVNGEDPVFFAAWVAMSHLLGFEPWAGSEVARRISDAGRFIGGRDAGYSSVVREVSHFVEGARKLMDDLGESHAAQVPASLAEALVARGSVVRDPEKLKAALQRLGRKSRARIALEALGLRLSEGTVGDALRRPRRPKGHRE